MGGLLGRRKSSSASPHENPIIIMCQSFLVRHRFPASSASSDPFVRRREGGWCFYPAREKLIFVWLKYVFCKTAGSGARTRFVYLLFALTREDFADLHSAIVAKLSKSDWRTGSPVWTDKRPFNYSTNDYITAQQFRWDLCKRTRISRPLLKGSVKRGKLPEI